MNPPILPNRRAAAQVSIGETPAPMLKATLPKRATGAGLKDLGMCLDFARRSVGWTVDRLARELQRDDKQVARWMRGEERTQVDAIFQVKELRAPFCIALARLSGECEETTVLSFRRQA